MLQVITLILYNKRVKYIVYLVDFKSKRKPTPYSVYFK